jgi:glycosyltransferase involved in cell wall biosynthesis
MKKIKVAHILHSVGGVDVSLRLILEYIDNEKFENIIIQGTKDVDKPYYDKDKRKIKQFRIPIFREVAPLSDFKAIRLAYKIVKKEKPHIIHAHSAKGGVIGRVVGALTKTTTIYSPHAFSYLSTNNGLKRNVYLAIEKFFTKGSSRVLALSESERQRAIQEVGFAGNKVLLYNNSIAPIEHIEPLAIAKTWPDEYICTVGRPSYQKNTELLVNIIHEIKKTRSVHLVIMGVGFHSGDLDKIKAQIDVLGLKDTITLLDWTSREDVFNILNKAQLYISTSRYEGMPYSVIEAMALAKACVVSDCDGNRDLITNGYNGYVIKEENPVLYSSKIISLLDDLSLNQKFSANAKATFLENFNLYENIGLMEDIYTSLANKE